MRTKYLAATTAAAALLAVPAGAGAATKVVYAGGPAGWAKTLLPAGVDNFLTNRVTIHTGDTVVWNGKALAGGFHTVDIPAPGAGDLPLILANGTVSGANDAAGNPFWFNGKVPALSFNATLFAPQGGSVYDGSARVASPLPAGPAAGKDFKVTFTKAGTYKYFCDVHPGMIGYVVVKPKGKAVPSARQDAAELKAEETKFATEARNVLRTKITGKHVSLGLAAPGGVEVFAMFPAKLTIKRGSTVSFSMPKHSRELHSATFGPAKYLKALSGSFNSPAPAPAAAYPSDPPGHIVLTPTSHGNGFANTGVLDQDPGTPAIPASGTITFGKPGTYHFICVVHPFMTGTIVVK